MHNINSKKFLFDILFYNISIYIMAPLLFLLLSCLPKQHMIQSHSSISIAEIGIVCTSREQKDCKVFTSTNKGSATRIKWNNNYYWLTAAHVCNAKTSVQNSFLLSKIVIVDVGGTGERNTASKMIFDEEKDLCLLEANKGPARQIAKHIPSNGDKITAIAYPGGAYGKDMYPIYEGRWAGKIENKCLSTIPVAGGSSGASIINKNEEVVAVISSVMQNFNHFTISTCLPEIKEFLEQATEPSPVQEQ